VHGTFILPQIAFDKETHHVSLNDLRAAIRLPGGRTGCNGGVWQFVWPRCE
jgi:hypothetical protein